MVVIFAVYFISIVFSEPEGDWTEPTGKNCDEDWDPNFEDDVANRTARIQCYYGSDRAKKQLDLVYVDADSGSENSTCGTVSDPCKSIEKAKRLYRYNTNVKLEDGNYTLEPPANLTGFYDPSVDFPAGQNPPDSAYWFTYFYITGKSQTGTIIKVGTKNYDTNMTIEGNYVYSVVLYVSSPNTNFSISNVTITLDSVPGDDDSVLVWIRNKANVTFEGIIFNGNGENWPKHLFEHSGGSLWLIKCIISPTGSAYIKGSIVYWDGTGRTEHTNHSSTHEGSWNIVDCNISNIYLNYNKSLLEEARNTEGNCSLNVNIEGCKFEDIYSVYASSSFGLVNRLQNGIPLGLIYTISEFTGGFVTITRVVFKNNDCNRFYAAPILVHSVKPSQIITLIDLTWNQCVNGSEGATIATYININSTNFIIEDIEKGSGNYFFNENGEHEYTNRITLAGPSKDELMVCIDTYDVNCESDTKGFPIWAIIVIVVVAVVVVAIVVIIVAIAVYVHKKKYSTLSDEEDYNESSSSSLRSAEKDDEMDSL